MSTSDMVLLISLNNEKEKLNEKNSNLFFNKLEDLMTVLSHYIVKDGEGAKKFITIKVTGTDLKKEAKKLPFQLLIHHFLKLQWRDLTLTGVE